MCRVYHQQAWLSDNGGCYLRKVDWLLSLEKYFLTEGDDGLAFTLAGPCEFLQQLVGSLKEPEYIARSGPHFRA